MSAKKQSSIFKYFGTPQSSKKSNTNQLDDSNAESQTPKSTRKSVSHQKDDTSKSKRRLINASDDDEDSPELKIEQKIKRPRINRIVSDDEDENVEPPSTPKSSNSKNQTPNKTLRSECIKSHKLPHQVISERKTNQRKEKDNLDDTNIDIEANENDALVPGIHETLDFLQPENIRDKNKRRPDDPNFDPKTLYVPPEYLKKLTPCMQQWWEIKRDHFDCVLFFKVGKFYELYHMDAVVGVNQLGFSYMKGSKFSHSGFPESSYGRMAASLVDAGYKVARVEQTETPEMLADRNSQAKCKDKVVRREVCQVTTKGTKVYGVHDIQSTDADANYLLAIIETEVTHHTSEIGSSVCTYGVCVTETSMGCFQLGQFEDDTHRSNLLLLLAHYPPGLILHPKGGLSDTTLNIFKTSVSRTTPLEALIPDKQFLSPTNTINFLLENRYFENDTDQASEWPNVLKTMFKGENMFTSEACDESKLAISAFGAVCWYLNYSKLDTQLISMKNFKHYELPHNDRISSTNMILDAMTLYHLRIVDNNCGLFKKMNYCKTAFGKRLLRQWITNPLCSVDVIGERLDAVQDLIGCGAHFISLIQKTLRKLPDLERLLTRISALGNKKQQTTHPDSRAIFFDKSYSKNNIIEFCKVINAFENVLTEVNATILEETNSTLLKRLTTFNHEQIDGIDQFGEYPDYRADIKKTKSLFDCEHALKIGGILPPDNMDDDYDHVQIEIQNISAELERYRAEQSQILKCNVQYFGTDKKRYQLQIPETKALKKKVPDDYQLESATKSVSRYSTVVTKSLLAKMIAAEDKRAKIVKRYTRRIFEEFNKQ